MPPGPELSTATAGAAGTRVVPPWLVNLALFQAGWWSVVLSAAHGQPAIGIAVVAAALLWHLSRLRPMRSEWMLLGLAAALGLAAETLLQSTGWLNYAGASGMLAPLWMVALWANFAATLNVALRPLRSRPWIAAALGGLGGPLAYWGGARLGAMDFHDPLSGLAAIALLWAIATPALLALGAALEKRV